MPLARLSIKAAIVIARQAVTKHPGGPGWWQVRTDLAPTVHRTGPLSFAEAKAMLREQRMFVALLKLGVESTEALPVAIFNRAVDRPWEEIVAQHMERRELTKAPT